MTTSVIDFFINQTSNIETVPVKIPVQDVALFLAGIFDGATVELQVSPDTLDPTNGYNNMSWYSSTDGTFTSPLNTLVKFWKNADLSDVWIRAKLSGATANTNLNFKMRPRTEMAI